MLAAPGKVWRRRQEEVRPDLDVLARTLRTTSLEALALSLEAGFVTLDQLALLRYPTKRGVVSAATRMNELFQAGLVDAFRPTRDGAGRRGGSAREIYCLTRAGATLAAAYRNERLPDVWRPRQQYVQMANVAHRLAIVDFWAALAVWVRAAGGRIVEFQVEPRFKEGRTVLSPDARFTVETADGRTHTMWLELDRGTESPRVFLERMAGYNAYYLATKEQYDNLPGVLIIVAGGRPNLGDGRPQLAPDRLLQLNQVVERPIAQWAFKRFKLATASELYEILPSPKGFLPEVRVDFGAAVCRVAGRVSGDRLPVFGSTRSENGRPGESTVESAGI